MWNTLKTVHLIGTVSITISFTPFPHGIKTPSSNDSQLVISNLAQLPEQPSCFPWSVTSVLPSSNLSFKKKKLLLSHGTFLVVQWLRLLTSNAGNQALIPGQGTRFLHAATKDPLQPNKYKKKNIAILLYYILLHDWKFSPATPLGWTNESYVVFSV